MGRMMGQVYADKCPCGRCRHRTLIPWYSPCLECWPNNWELFVKNSFNLQTRFTFTGDKKLCPYCNSDLEPEPELDKKIPHLWFWDGSKVWGCPNCQKHA